MIVEGAGANADGNLSVPRGRSITPIENNALEAAARLDDDCLGHDVLLAGSQNHFCVSSVR
jgi:hypothetical protein